MPDGTHGYPHMCTSLRWQRKLDRLEMIKNGIPGFSWDVTRDRHIHNFVFTNYPTVNGQRPTLDALVAHVNGSGPLRFDDPTQRQPRGTYVAYPAESLAPYAMNS